MVLHCVCQAQIHGPFPELAHPELQAPPAPEVRRHHGQQPGGGDFPLAEGESSHSTLASITSCHFYLHHLQARSPITSITWDCTLIITDDTAAIEASTELIDMDYGITILYKSVIMC